jgi:hypothetical protein
MGEIDSGVVDIPDWKPEAIAEQVEKACRNCGKHYFIPCLTQGINVSSFEGVYEATDIAIDHMSEKIFLGGKVIGDEK